MGEKTETENLSGVDEGLVAMGLGSKLGHLDSGSTLHFPLDKLPEKTESSYLLVTWVVYRFARNDGPTRLSLFGLGSKFGRLDSGSTLHVPVKKFPETTESSYFIDTRSAYRSARNDDRRNDSP